MICHSFDHFTVYTNRNSFYYNSSYKMSPLTQFTHLDSLFCLFYRKYNGVYFPHRHTGHFVPHSFDLFSPSYLSAMFLLSVWGAAVGKQGKEKIIWHNSSSLSPPLSPDTIKTIPPSFQFILYCFWREGTNQEELFPDRRRLYLFERFFICSLLHFTGGMLR